MSVVLFFEIVIGHSQKDCFLFVPGLRGFVGIVVQSEVLKNNDGQSDQCHKSNIKDT